MNTIMIKRKYFDLIKKGDKILEVRVAYNSIKKIEKGEKVKFVAGEESQFVLIKDKRTYSSFDEMLGIEDYTKITELRNRQEVSNILKEIYPIEKEKLGVVVFEIVKI